MPEDPKVPADPNNPQWSDLSPAERNKAIILGVVWTGASVSLPLLNVIYYQLHNHWHRIDWNLIYTTAAAAVIPAMVQYWQKHKADIALPAWVRAIPDGPAAKLQHQETEKTTSPSGVVTEKSKTDTVVVQMPPQNPPAVS